MPHCLVWLYILFTLALHVFDQFLNYRQWKRLHTNTEVPAKITGKVTPEENAKSIAYSKDKLAFSMLCSSSETVKDVFNTLLYLSPLMWHYCGNYVGNNPVYHAFAFVFFGSVLETVMAVPFELYSTFLIEEKHGFNKTTIKTFIVDRIKMLAISAVIFAPLIWGVIWILDYFGSSFPFFLWVFTSILVIFLIVISPHVFMPLFNKYTNLKNEKLREGVNALAKKVNYPLVAIYEMDGSTRSAHSNAFMYGLFNEKRIVFFDTIFELPRSSILAVMAHELGHWYHAHMWQMMAFTFAKHGLFIWICSWIYQNPIVFMAFGYDEVKLEPLIGLFLAYSLLKPLSFVFEILQTLLSRKNEYEADKYAYERGFGKDICEALLGLFVQNSGNLDPDPFVEWFRAGHPSLLERITRIGELQAQKEILPCIEITEDDRKKPEPMTNDDKKTD